MRGQQFNRQVADEIEKVVQKACDRLRGCLSSGRVEVSSVPVEFDRRFCYVTIHSTSLNDSVLRPRQLRFALEAIPEFPADLSSQDVSGEHKANLTTSRPDPNAADALTALVFEALRELYSRNHNLAWFEAAQSDVRTEATHLTIPDALSIATRHENGLQMARGRRACDGRRFTVSRRPGATDYITADDGSGPYDAESDELLGVDWEPDSFVHMTKE